MLVYILLGILVFLFILDKAFKLNENVKLIRKVPRPNETFFFGNALGVLVTPVELFTLGRKFANQFNGIYGWWAFKLSVVNIYNPEDIEVVISSMKHMDKSPAYVILKPWLREGLLLSSGAKWHSRRKILTPAFHFNILRKFWPILEDNAHNLVQTLKKTRGEPVDIIPLISEYTLNSICETAMGMRLYDDITHAGRTYKEAIYRLGQLCVTRFSRIYLLPDLIFQLSSTGRNTYKNLETIYSFTKRIIKERKEYIDEHGIKFGEEMPDDDKDDVYAFTKKKKTAMLDLLISAEKEGVIDKRGIQEEVDTFMFEGHDTTASGLSYCLMLLANNKHVQDKIVSELQEIFGDSDRQATTDDLSLMRYLERCIKESLRLYPPVPFISRKLSEPVTLSNYKIKPGTDVNIHIYDLHRREDLFPDPLVYDPDRFLPENSVGRHLYAYIPFSAGPRNCIGQKFAMMEMKSCLVAILRKYELQPVTRPEDLEFIADLVLRTTKPVYVKFVERK